MKFNQNIIFFLFIILFTIVNNKSCLSIQNCLQCESQICLECLPNFSKISDGTCKPIKNIIKNCYIYSQTGLCSECQVSFRLTQQNQCKKDLSGCINYAGKKCLECGFGKYLSKTNECVGIINCQSYDQNRKCIECAKDFVLQNQTCIMNYKKCKQIDLITGGCKSCPIGYSLNGMKCFFSRISKPNNCAILNQDYSCLYCQHGFVNIQGKCHFNRNRFLIDFLEVIPQNIQLPKILTAILPKVKNVIINCKNIDEKGKCIQCNQGCKLQNNRCFYYKQNNSPCATVHPIKGTCLTCKYLYVYMNGKCITDNTKQTPIDNCKTSKNNLCEACLQGYWNNNNVCKPSVKNCKYYDQTTGECIFCNQGYISNNSICKSQDPYCEVFDKSGDCLMCRNKYFLNKIKMKCTIVPNLCKQFDIGNGTCNLCHPNYILIQGNCQIPVPVKGNDINCKYFNVYGVCVLCNIKYYFSKLTKKCNQRIKNCTKINQNTDNCQICAEGYTIFQGKCKSINNDPNCKVPDGKDCILCNTGYNLIQSICKLIPPYCGLVNQITGACDTCYSGYVLIGNQCQKFVPDPHCKNYIGTKCTDCQDRYYLKNNKCNIVNQTCKTYDKNQGNCLSCYIGYKVQGNVCNVYHDDQNCISWSNITCLQCHSGFIINKANGKCNPQMNLCSSTDATKTKCLSCYPGYFVVNGACTTQVNKDPNCQIKNGPKCEACSSRFWLKNNSCIQVNTQCAEYNPSNGNCTSCYYGYILKGPECVVMGPRDTYCATILPIGQCTQCTPGYYPDPKGCQMISILCQHFDMVSKICTQCKTGYVLQDNECLAPAFGIDANCLHYTNSYCDKCSQKHYLQNYVCTQVDSNCLKFNYQTNTCEQCGPGFVISVSKCDAAAV